MKKTFNDSSKWGIVEKIELNNIKKITAKRFEDFNQWKLVFKHKYFDEISVRNLLDFAFKKYYLRFSWIKKFLINKLIS